LGDKKGIATSLANMGLMLHELGDRPSARTHLEESLAICRELGDRAGTAASLASLADVATEEGALVSARALLTESVAIRVELGDSRGVALSLEGFANLALASGRPLAAARLYGAAERLRTDTGFQRLRDDARLRAARAACANDAAFEEAWREGDAMTVQQAISHGERTGPS
jgi:hypothetical protein